MKNRLRSFALFWYDFLVGDDWTIAAGVLAALALTAVLSRSSSSAWWWILPAATGVLLALSVWRAACRGSTPA
jgi:hypothetical protein